MKDRIIQFLRAENKSSAQFAEEIGVQPSGISHIISGRNNPSLDFVIKMLDRYKYISPDWLLFGKGTMYKASAGMPTLFDQDNEAQTSREINQIDNFAEAKKIPEITVSDTKSTSVKNMAEVSRIVIFYNDRSFEEYTPSEE